VEDYVYQDMMEAQKKHWWFKARRELIKTALDKYLPSRSLDILEIGSGTGGNLSMLQQYGNVSAMEKDPFAATWAERLTGIKIKLGSLPDNIPFTEKYDVICLFDVLEHIADDKTAFLKVIKLLKPGGIIFLTVPAHQWLYGVHDKINHHYRRYSSSALKKIITFDGLSIKKFSHFNFLLFPFMLFSRLIDKIHKPEKSFGYNIPGNLLNTLFYYVFSLEKYIINKIYLPFGGSVFAVIKANNIKNGL
jgi:SAM-dependent methyltransferase